MKKLLDNTDRYHEKLKLIYLTPLLAGVLAVGPAAAATALDPPSTTGNVKSDYAQAVEAGQNAIKTDPAVAANAQEVKSAENVEGDVDDGQVEVQEQVEPQEATEPAEAAGGESSGGGGGESAGSSSGQDSTAPSSSGDTGSTSPAGGN